MSNEADEAVDEAELVDGRAASTAPTSRQKSVDPEVDADADDQRQERHGRQNRRLKRRHQRPLFDVRERYDVDVGADVGFSADGTEVELFQVFHGCRVDLGRGGLSVDQGFTIDEKTLR